MFQKEKKNGVSDIVHGLASANPKNILKEASIIEEFIGHSLLPVQH